MRRSAGRFATACVLALSCATRTAGAADAVTQPSAAPASLAAAAGASGVAPTDSPPMPLELSVNGAPGDVTLVVSRGGDAFVSVHDLAQAGVVVPARAPTTTLLGSPYLALRTLAPTLTYTVDERNLRLILTVGAALLAGTRVELAPAAPPAATAVTSGFVNYTLASSTANGARGAASAYEELGAGGAAGVFTSTFSENAIGSTRGLTSFVSEDQGKLRRTGVGDIVAGGGTLGSDVVLGGIGVQRAFDVQPRFLQRPSSDISGTVLVPTTADVYVNGAYVKTVQLAPGPFSVGDLQLATGANATTVVLRDAAGNSTTLTSNSYVGTDVLRKGVSDYEYDVGFVRPNVFALDDRYGPLAALGRYRIGLSNAVTFGGRVEAQAGLVSAGPRIDVGSRIGSFAAYGAFSDERGVFGSASAFAYSYGAGPVAFELSTTHYSPEYANLQFGAASDRRLSEVDARMFAHLSRLVSLELQSQNVVDRDLPRTAIQSADVRVTVSPRANLDVLAQHLTEASSLWTVGATLALQLGRTANAMFSSQTTGGQTTNGFAFTQPAPPGTGLGYRFESDVSDGQTLVTTTVQDRTSYGEAQLFASDNAGASAASLVLDGGLAIFKQGVFASRTLSGPYALAEVPDVPRARVAVNGTDAGATDGRGLVVVPGLSPYVPNTVSVTNLDGLADVSDENGTTTVVPKNRSGVVAPIGAHRVRIWNGTVAILRAGSRIVPAYGMLTLAGAAAYESDIGGAGAIYFENLAPGTYRATIHADLGPCSFDVTVPRSTALVNDLGALTCAL